MNRFKAGVSYLAIAVAITAIMAGCQTTGDGDSTPIADAQAVYCPKCQTTWVQKPYSVGRVTLYRTEKSTTCAECESAAANFFKTGKLEHTCKVCGDAPVHCVIHAGKPTAADAAATDQSVACSKCQTTWVKEKQIVGHPSRTTNYIIRNKQKMTCADCQTAVDNFFATGKLQHACKACGGDMKPCQKHAN